MSAPLDLLTDKLADAPLTPGQRAVWRDLCAELVLARVQIQELETRLKNLQRSEETREKEPPTLLNRPDFNREVARLLAFDDRYGGTSSVIYFNIDNLEAIRNRHGTAIADSAIRCITDTLASQVRRSDILGRLAPDEFGILLPRCNQENAWSKSEAIADKLYENLMNLWGPGLKPKISYGAYTFSEKEEATDSLKLAAQMMTKLVRN